MSPAANPIQEIQAVKQMRVVREYTFPEALRKADPSLPKTIGLKQLSAEEELMASKIGRTEYLRSQYTATKLSIVSLDGKPVTYADTALETFWERSSPKIRALLMDWYTRQSTPSMEESDDFFKSEAVKV